ncbi:hypothetical protein FRC11_013814, partial [Ceratobasidium sp. 423]
MTKIEHARVEFWDLVIFVGVALAIATALHEDTLSVINESYRGHRPIGYKPKPKPLGLAADDSIPAVRARDLPRVGAPCALAMGTAAVSTSTSGPVPVARKTTDKSSTSSSTPPARSKLTAFKRTRPDIPRPIATPATSRPARAHKSTPSSATITVPSQATYYTRGAAMVAYHRTMQRGWRADACARALHPLDLNFLFVGYARYPTPSSP